MSKNPSRFICLKGDGNREKSGKESFHTEYSLKINVMDTE